MRSLETRRRRGIRGIHICETSSTSYLLFGRFGRRTVHFYTSSHASPIFIKMNDLNGLEGEISNLLSNVQSLKTQRNEYLATLQDVLDVYLFSVMEEEDPLYDLIHRRFNDIDGSFDGHFKILSPFNLQLNILISLPFVPAQLEVEYGGFGFVKLKLPANIEDSMTCSKVWRDACLRGIQKSLLRHVTSWKDGNDYLQQTAVLKWFSKVVKSALDLTGDIPNYNILMSETKHSVILELTDLRNDFKFTVTLLPVIVFPTCLLPSIFYATVPQDPSCDMWMAECRSNASAKLLWGISLWQHEKKLIESIGKNIIEVIKSLRDGCEWHLLTNYHIQTLVIHEYRRNSEKFQDSKADLLLYLLLQLRNRLVSREGLPSIWDSNHNLLSGMSGHDKSGLARLVTKTRASLETLSGNPRELFRVQTYSPIDHRTGATSSDSQNETSSISPEPNSARPHNQSNPNEDQEARLPPRAEFRSSQTPGSQQGVLMQATENWWAVGAAGVGLAAAILGGFALSRFNNNRN